MGLLTPLAVKIGSIPWLPRYLRQIMGVDNLIRRVTRGRLTLLDLAGLPNLVLTVPGRKSGIPRSTPLLCAPDGADILIAGSNFGGAKEPIWIKNIEATSEVTILFRRRETPMVVRPIEGDERAAAWLRLVETWPNFLMYEKRTDRQIKLFRLTTRP